MGDDRALYESIQALVMAQTSLPGRLAQQMVRVAELRAQYLETDRRLRGAEGPRANLNPAIVLMAHAIAAAIGAIGSGNIAAQIRSLRELGDFES